MLEHYVILSKKFFDEYYSKISMFVFMTLQILKIEVDIEQFYFLKIFHENVYDIQFISFYHDMKIVEI